MESLSLIVFVRGLIFFPNTQMGHSKIDPLPNHRSNFCCLERGIVYTMSGRWGIINFLCGGWSFPEQPNVIHVTLIYVFSRCANDHTKVLVGHLAWYSCLDCFHYSPNLHSQQTYPKQHPKTKCPNGDVFTPDQWNVLAFALCPCPQVTLQTFLVYFGK